MLFLPSGVHVRTDGGSNVERERLCEENIKATWKRSYLRQGRSRSSRETQESGLKTGKLGDKQ